MKKSHIALSVLLGLILVWGILAILPKHQAIEGNNPFRAPQDGPPHIIAHAGGNMEFPDNTLEAMYNAYSVDPDVILEMDVALTADNVVVLTHDTTFDRKTTLIEAHVHEIEYSYLMEEEIDFGYENELDSADGFNVSGDHYRYETYDGDTVTPLDVAYPEGVTARHPEKFLATTLEEVIIAFPENYMIVELKQFGDQGALLFDAVIELFDALDDDYNVYERITIASFRRDMYDRYVELKETTHPQLMFSPQEDAIRKFYTLHWPRLTFFFNEPVNSFQVPMGQGGIDLTTRQFINAAHRHNIAIHYWTINDEDDMRRLIELGADGILTDRPTLLKSIIDEYYD